MPYEHVLICFETLLKSFSGGFPSLFLCPQGFFICNAIIGINC